MLADHYPVYDEQAHYYQLVNNEANVVDAMLRTLYRIDKRFSLTDKIYYADTLFAFTESWSLRVERFINPKGYED